MKSLVHSLYLPQFPLFIFLILDNWWIADLFKGS